MTFNIYKFDESVLGVSTPDPLRFAFAKKHSAHAGGSSTPIAQDKKLNLFDELMLTEGKKQDKRCLYIHIPFCRVRCTFCNFFQNAASRKLVDDYFEALLCELKQKAKTPWAQSGLFHAVYIGGGTPTDLSALQVEQLGKAIREHFPLANDVEMTLEGRINRFSDEMFDRALEGGFNRFSFGIQSFNTKVRRSAKRLDDREVVLERISSLSKTEQAPIVLDLLYGLPHQTMDVFEQDLHDYMSTGAHGIDLYQLIVGGDAPMLNLVDKGKIPPPATTPDKASMYLAGVEFMEKHKVKKLSVNHWARDNRERSIYNSLAKTYAEVLPIGCGAGGNVGGHGIMQHRTLETYMDSVKRGELPIAMMTKQSELEPIFSSLKAGFDSGVVRRSLLPTFMGQDTFDYLKPLFSHWQNNELVQLSEDYLTLTNAGSFWAVTLAQSVIQILNAEYFEANPQARPSRPAHHPHAVKKHA
ncbi:heme anaerobic degradation radical SAM methyltransferase ChuW/HutW [Vibrio sp. Isolate30]|uniref:heme anaerobic degradation radical SAM methyltransferase ChuW/HutW n=1 Tax=Vibrio sp. Isolate30 TaxID=2908536 RepID=UPI001EFEE9E2|nr:heme anaerobic degradation radical SAM methyltransferase ChuW/HutW [Vibrio sp. Isolate30]MCG9629758.1 heme anaerobic degradation radical SAM methyltransferase ChuW/HutW [Vibrio sp. Isolate30]